MAEVVFLRINQATPAEGDRIVVSRDLKGRFILRVPLGPDPGAPIAMPPGSDDDRAAAIAAACDLADERGVARVYVEPSRADI